MLMRFSASWVRRHGRGIPRSRLGFVRGEAVDHRADIFALGAVLYEMLTGKRAFARSTSAETMTAVLQDDPPAISQVVKAAPPGLQRVVQRCLEKSPEQHFQSSSDLAFALEALSDSGSSLAVAMAQSSRPRWFWLVAAGVLAAVAALVIAWWRTPPPVPVVSRSLNRPKMASSRPIYLRTDRGSLSSCGNSAKNLLYALPVW